MISRVCSNCQKQNLLNARYCTGCGAQLPALTGRKKREPTIAQQFQDVRARLDELVPAADRAFERGSYETAARHYRRAYELLGEARNLGEVVYGPGKARGAGWLASLLSGGLGLEDLVVFPVVAGLTRRFLRSGKDQLLQAQQYVAAQELCSIGNSKELRREPGIEYHMLLRFYFLYTGITPRKADREVIENVIERQIPLVDDRLPELNELLAMIGSDFGWTRLLPTLNGLGYGPGARRGTYYDASESRGVGPNQTGPVSLDEAYTLLGVSRGSTLEEIKSAYRSKAAEWHPDHLGQIPDELRALALERMKRINEAYDLIVGTHKG